MQGEQREPEEDAQCDQSDIALKFVISETTYMHLQSLQNKSGVEEGNCDTKGEGLKESEYREENQVGGMTVAFPE